MARGKERNEREGKDMEENDFQGEEREGSKSSHESQGKDGNDLKEREYRDNEGNVHHHTRSYMEGHDD